MRTRSSWERRATVLVLAAALLVVGGSFQPWVATGTRLRNSYEVVDAGVYTGLFDAVGPLALLWYLLPLLAAMSWLAAWFDRTRVATRLGMAVGLVGVLAAAAVEVGPVPTRSGVGITLVGGLLAVGAGMAGVIRSSLAAGRPSPAAQDRGA